MAKRHSVKKGAVLVRQRQRPLFWWLLGIFFVLGLILIGFSYFLIYSNQLRVKQVTIEGTTDLTAENLALTASIQMAGASRWRALLGPDNIFFWRFSPEPNLTASFPNLDIEAIDAGIWSREVAISVSEKKLRGVWCDKENCFAFDNKGIAFALVPEIEGALILKVDDQNDRKVILGHPLLPETEWFERLLSTIEITRESDFAISSVGIKDLRLREWEITTDSGLVLQFSLNFVPNQLRSILESLQDRLTLSNLNSLDFRVPNRVYYR